MVEDQAGQPRDSLRTAPWLKLFGAFKVAIDPKKLLLAGAGLVVMWVGWFILAFVLSALYSEPPKWTAPEAKDQEQRELAWKDFKEARRRYNLAYEMAGTPPKSPTDARMDAADLSDTLQDYETLDRLTRSLRNYDTPIQVEVVDAGPIIMVGKEPFPIAEKDFKISGSLRPGDIKVVDAKSGKVLIQGTAVTIAKADTLEKYLAEARSPERLRQEMASVPGGAGLLEKAVLLVRSETPVKPFGRLRINPWSEYRGPNPYLLVTGNVAGPEGSKARPWEQGHFAGWFFRDQVPVLLEPLLKFLQPVIYLFRAGASRWNFIYLWLVILWTLATWAIFGGAITRMAAVQVARHNEKVGMMDALRFARSRLQSFFSAPVFPLVFLAVITIFLLIFGFLEGYTGPIGDILIAGLFWPLVLLAGLVMAVVLVGLVGWPLMYATISSEGSDSFDALSRSYSYVYQAPWHYIWYWAVALVYGAVLVFFVGFMGSLLVYLGKWGVNQAYVPAKREPAYLFQYAPQSFGWRDLLLHDSPNVTTAPRVLPTGRVVPQYELDPASNYTQTISWNNNVGAFLIMIWLGLVFLLVVGFGYSYFWSAATIIYLLMRRKVDDTEIDEIYLDEEEEEPFTPQSAAPIGTTTVAAAGAPVMVESPTLRSPPGDSAAAPSPPAPATEPVTPPPADGPTGGMPLSP